MDWRIVWMAFGTVFLAELGDKTQLAVLTMTASSAQPLAVFLGAAAGLVSVTMVGVLAGGVLTRWLPPTVIQRAAAIAFIGIGFWLLLRPE